MVQKKLLPLALLTVIFLLVGCTKTSNGGGVTSSFNYTGAPIIITALSSANVTFRNNSTNASGYFWNFGDGTNSIEANPTHAYLLNGSYTVSLTAFGKGGGATTSYQTVNIYGQVSITKISINNLPLLQPNGTSWNYPSTGGPNIFVDIIEGSGIIHWDGSDSIKNNVTKSELPLSWSCTYYSQTPKVLTERYLVVYNNNSGSITSIDSLPFLWSNYLTPPNAFPSSISLTDSAKGVSATLNLQWQ
jgi:PKD repeat protein